MSRKRPQPAKSLFQTTGFVLSLDAETVLRGYYQAVFALSRGSSQRPPLPLELVLYICRLARFVQPSPSKDLSTRRIIPGPSMPPVHDGRHTKRETLLKTPPLVRSNAGSLGVGRFEVVMKSVRKHQRPVSASAGPSSLFLSDRQCGTRCQGP